MGKKNIELLKRKGFISDEAYNKLQEIDARLIRQEKEAREELSTLKEFIALRLS